MKPVDAVVAFAERLKSKSGKHVYAFAGDGKALKQVEEALGKVRTPEGNRMPEVVSLNVQVMSRIPNETQLSLATNEAINRYRIQRELQGRFSQVLADYFSGNNILIVKNFELLVAYRVDLEYIRSLSIDEKHTAFLVPGKISNDTLIAFDYCSEAIIFMPNILQDKWEVD